MNRILLSLTATLLLLVGFTPVAHAGQVTLSCPVTVVGQTADFQASGLDPSRQIIWVVWDVSDRTINPVTSPIEYPAADGTSSFSITTLGTGSWSTAIYKVNNNKTVRIVTCSFIVE